MDALKHLRATTSENDLFDLTDSNGDGKISLEEFCDVYNTVYGSCNEKSEDDGLCAPAHPPIDDATYTKRVNPENPPDLIISQKTRSGRWLRRKNLEKSQSEEFRDKKERLKAFRDRLLLYRSDTAYSIRRKQNWRANLQATMRQSQPSGSNIFSSLDTDKTG